MSKTPDTSGEVLQSYRSDALSLLQSEPAFSLFPTIKTRVEGTVLPKKNFSSAVESQMFREGTHSKCEMVRLRTKGKRSTLSSSGVDFRV